ncbi:MAG: PIN domain-containing protein [Fibrobacteres bacterium]|nr:PIN domain-containing protein [Fibrobacterota bacterium]
MKGDAVFVDTNILYYAYDKLGGKKHEIAKELVSNLWKAETLPSISVQVLQELYVTLIKRGASATKSNEIVSDYFAWNIVENTLHIFKEALRIQERYKTSFWDASILASADAFKANIIYTEDLNHNQIYGTTKAVNPFM